MSLILPRDLTEETEQFAPSSVFSVHSVVNSRRAGFDESGSFFVIEGGADFVHDRLEGRLVMNRDVGQDFAVESPAP
jgi:hypothetical protein